MEENHQCALSDREFEVLACLVQGLPHKQIASQLDVSKSTVDFHVGNILRKLDAENGVQAVVEAIRRGWVKI